MRVHGQDIRDQVDRGGNEVDCHQQDDKAELTETVFARVLGSIRQVGCHDTEDFYLNLIDEAELTSSCSLSHRQVAPEETGHTVTSSHGMQAS